MANLLAGLILAVLAVYAVLITTGLLIGAVLTVVVPSEPWAVPGARCQGIGARDVLGLSGIVSNSGGEKRSARRVFSSAGTRQVTDW